MDIESILHNQSGVIFGEPAIVHRSTYSGRDIVGKNSRFEAGFVDDRGYVPVEWWIMSTIQAGNDIPKDGEGLTKLILGAERATLKSLEAKLLGKYSGGVWPLTKVLDIGGPARKTTLGTEEVPPIPVHIHSGEVNQDGSMNIKTGKLEAYWFPPLDLPPYSKDLGVVKTRLGLKPGVTKEEFSNALKEFGKSDLAYSYLSIYEINPNEGWTIRPGVLHAPGPWLTFEIQRPQDDYHLCAWQLGKCISEHDLEHHRKSFLLKGLKDEADFIEKALDWPANTATNFASLYRHEPVILAEGEWGRRYQIFFGEFYGEGFEVRPGKAASRSADGRPFAGIVWSGKGKINGNALDVDNPMQKEFLVVAGTELVIENSSSDNNLIIYTVFPIEEK